ncbi:MAG: nucleotide-binding protein [Bacteroidales bacterium]|nr:nucleotide-binding protein [Bacteroidales bacterium]MCF8454341.1 nucleotide-binding protein [Bacteroidales bacterium]
MEIVKVGSNFQTEIIEAIEKCNSLQDDFIFSFLPLDEEQKFQTLNFKKAVVSDLIPLMIQKRNDLRGYHPFMIFIFDGELTNGEYENLFGYGEPENGIGLLSSNNITEIIIPSDKMVSYFIFFFARYAINTMLPDHHNHYDTRGCVFDFRELKTDLTKSMRSGAICDQCRMEMLSGDYSLTTKQFISLNILFEESGRILNEKVETKVVKTKQKIFIGSSVEGLEVARTIQSELSHDFELEIWNQGTFDILGKSYLECLEEATKKFNFGIFVFTPDDKITSRGEQKSMARDNVIFELGMFLGKLSRLKSFIVYPTNENMHIMSDFNGITTANYDSEHSNLKASLGPACSKMRDSIKYAT